MVSDTRRAGRNFKRPPARAVAAGSRLLYSLPQIDRNLSAQAQLSYDFLSHSMHLFAFTIGVGYAL